MKKTTLKNILNITAVLIVIFSVCEIEEKIKPVLTADTKTISAAKADEDGQYIPKNLDYSEMIKQIKAEEGIEEEPEEKTANNDYSGTSIENEITIDGNLSPSAYLDAAKEIVKDALSEQNEQMKRYKVKKALKYYKEYLKYDEGNIDALLGAGAMATYLGRETEAKNLLMEAYATYPKSPDVHKALGDYSFKFNNFNNAIEYYNLSLASGNLKDYATNIATAVCYEKLGDIERAKQYYEVSLYLNPESELAKQRLEMYARMEYEGYSSDPRTYEAADKVNEENDVELETLILDTHQIK